MPTVHLSACSAFFINEMAHLPMWNVVDRSLGDIQNGRLGDEDARGREYPREKDGQDFPTDGQKQGRQTEPG